MWEPNFAHTEAHKATLQGYHRALCIYSHVYRGTPENPGLVFGLDVGGTADGMAFKVAHADAEPVLKYLYDREMVTNVYVPTWASVDIEEVGLHQALIFAADQNHEQYAGALSAEAVVALIKAGHGKAGPCTEYVVNTYAHLRQMHIRDDTLADIVKSL